jgi:flagellar basal-body rod protein FlgB
MDVKSTDALLRLMSAAALRGRVLANNVANQNTPGYHRQVVRFEQEFLAEMGRHHPDLARVSPRVEEDADATTRPDGNTVSLEEELSASRENRLLYEMYAAILQGRMDMLRSAINGAR